MATQELMWIVHTHASMPVDDDAPSSLSIDTESDEPDYDWNYLGEGEISEKTDSGSRYIEVPEHMFREGVLENPDEGEKPLAYWSYEIGSGLAIISDEKLEGQPLRKPVADGEAEYKRRGSRKQQDETNNYSLTIPSYFFDDHEGSHGHSEALNGQVPEEARMKEGETRYFLTREEILNAPKKSCFVLTRPEFNKTISDSEELQDSIAPIPNFIDK